MNRADRSAWRTARTLADLGELTARWLEGTVREQPTYYGPVDVDDPEALVPVLVALNRAGYMTTQSQDGHTARGFDGAIWQQCAAVEGFATPEMVQRITMCTEVAGLTLIVHEPPPRWSRRIIHDQAVDVTWRAGQPCTSFGAKIPQHYLRDTTVGYGICRSEAIRAVCGAHQVTVIDPEPGRPDLLWNTLTRTLIGKTA